MGPWVTHKSRQDSCLAWIKRTGIGVQVWTDAPCREPVSSRLECEQHPRKVPLSTCQALPRVHTQACTHTCAHTSLGDMVSSPLDTEAARIL